MLFQSLFNSESNSLASGSTPQKLQGSNRQLLAKYASVPDSVSEGDVMAVARESGELEGHTVLAQQWSEQAIALQQASLAELEIRINHSKRSMDNENQFRKKIAKHGKNIHQYNLDNQVVAENLTGYESAFNKARNTVDI
ncbi:MAG: hypothetical protein ACYT04_38115 [Nostoc sp.]